MNDTDWDNTKSPTFQQAFGAFALDRIRFGGTPLTTADIDVFSVGFEAGFEYGRNS